MYRVLRPHGRALIIDMRRDAPNDAITDQVAKMHLGWIDALMTRAILSSLRKRAYANSDFVRMLAATPFGSGDIVEQPLGLEIRLVK